MDKEQDLDFAEDFEEIPSETGSKIPVPDEFANPAGISRGACDTDTDEGGEQDASCDLEATAQIEDMFLEESKPGTGIAGYEGEEVGG